jgi:hypothetical protein
MNFIACAGVHAHESITTSISVRGKLIGSGTPRPLREKWSIFNWEHEVGEAALLVPAALCDLERFQRSGMISQKGEDCVAAAVLVKYVSELYACKRVCRQRRH